MFKIITIVLCSIIILIPLVLCNFNSVLFERKSFTIPDPPPVKDVVRMARYIVHYSNYTSLGHISHQKATNNYPSSRIYSTSDGLFGESTGTPYIYTSFLDSAPRDLKIDPRCSMSTSLLETPYCKIKGYDPQDPRCGQVILTGTLIFLQNNTAEWKFAKKILFERHPAMKTWPEDHHFFFAKMNITYVQIVDYFGGSKYPTVKEYYEAIPPELPTYSEYNVDMNLY